MSFGLSNISQNSVLLNTNHSQSGLLNSYTKLSSGKAINTAADNPSGLAIYQSLTAQANGFDAGAQNGLNAENALTVAQGGLTTVNTGLQQLNVLAIQANNGFLSPSQAGYLQTEANQITQQINTVSNVTQFNGVNLLNGSVSGFQPATPSSATTTSNDVLQSGSGNVVSSVTAANANFAAPPSGNAQGFGGTSTTNSTIQIQIVNNGGTAQAVATITDNATGQTVQAAPVNSGGTITGFENVNVQLGNFTTADVGTTATIQIQQATAASNTGPALNVQTGPNAGNSIQVAIPGVTTQNLQVNNLNITSQAGATNAQGEIGNALQSVLHTEAQIGAQQVSTNYDIQNANIASVNLTASSSAISDLNYGSEVTHNNNLNLLSNIGLSVLSQLNASRGYLTGLLNHAA